MKRLYRVYYNTFDDEIHERVKREIEERIGGRVVDHPSRVHREFRFIEVYTEDKGREDEIRDLVRSLAGTMYVRVDWIET
ncbi:MAG: hypothetical protein GSR78_05280 [Desulfurococcales archaeon]|nr:hypothetical protein [Desulfurococcales archaeon]